MFLKLLFSYLYLIIEKELSSSFTEHKIKPSKHKLTEIIALSPIIFFIISYVDI
jgi:hypothetical protein